MPAPNEKHVVTDAAAGDEVGVVIWDAKRGHWVANTSFDHKLGDADEDDTWRVGTFANLAAAQAALGRLHAKFDTEPARRKAVADYKAGTRDPVEDGKAERVTPARDLGGGR